MVAPRSESPSARDSWAPATRSSRPHGRGRGLARYLPFVTTFRDYRAEYLRPDLVAGLTTALFTIPQGMAYALITGFPPSSGLATGIVASVLGAAMGSSEFLINGPTNALSVMLAANAALFATHGDPLGTVVTLTFLIGAVQIIAGLAR